MDSVKTCYQVGIAIDDRIAIAADAVMVHQHGAPMDAIIKSMAGWQKRGFRVGRMFFADSDAGKIYSLGQWDAINHLADCEASRDGITYCGDRPYMLPTDGWCRYLEEMARASVRGGAQYICPEEPLAHLAGGYEPSFAPIWEKRYGRPLDDPHKDALATYRTGQLQAELYAQLVGRIAAVTKHEAAGAGRRVPLLLPVHSLYSNLALGLVAPLGTSLPIEGVDGYIGQIWTGPVRWTMTCYSGENKSFFASAYILYDYFSEVAVGSGKKLYLLVDPVEDDPRHTWADFRQWYFHCAAAMLFIRDVDNYELMPWPERIFLPGYETGGSTPAPESFRIAVLSLSQAMQDMPAGGQWCDGEGKALPDPPGVGVAVADSVLWNGDTRSQMNRTYGWLMPLVMSSLPASSCLLERAGDESYLDRFKVIVLSYLSCKPPAAQTNEALARWVRKGGVLVVLGQTDEMDQADDLWWRKQGEASPLDHLMKLLALDSSKEGDFAVGRGRVLRRLTDPAKLAEGDAVEAKLLPLMDHAIKQAGGSGLRPQKGMVMRRGPFMIAHALGDRLELRGPMVDLLDKDLSVVEKQTLARGESGIYRLLPPATVAPQVVHATHRLMSQQPDGNGLKFRVKGPSGTPAVVRIIAGSGTGSIPAASLKAVAANAEGKSVPVSIVVDGQTVRVNFVNQPDGVFLSVGP